MSIHRKEDFGKWSGLRVKLGINMVGMIHLLDVLQIDLKIFLTKA